MNCPACGNPITLRPGSISHTIVPDEELCSECGQREFLDVAWASATRTGILRARIACQYCTKQKKEERK